MAGNFEWEKGTNYEKRIKQKERRGQGLNPGLPGERPMSYPIDHEDLIHKVAFLSGFKLYFCQFFLETRAKLETLPFK